MAVYTYTTEVVSSILRFSSPANHLFELATYSYNQSSSDYIEVTEYGFISDIISESEDYGSIIENAVLHDDYNYISTSTTPTYGLVKNIISTTSIIFIVRSVGGVEFALQGGSYEAFGSPYIGYGGLTKVSGGISKESFVPATEVGSGTLFNFISKEERRTYSYNGSAEVIKADDDFGLITTAPLEYEDFGAVSEVVNYLQSEDYGLITTVDNKPYGSLGFVGDASKTVIFSLTAFVGGSLFGIGGAAESVTSFIPSDIGLFNFTGGLEKESFVQSPYVGSGTLFNFIKKEERRTYSYNNFAQVFKIDSDYGFISAAESQQEDYGLITDFASGVNAEDYGLITTSDQKPYGTLKFVGDNAQTTRFRLRYFGSGSLFEFISSAESSVATPPASGLFKFSGVATEKNIPSYVGSGTLFNFITKEERRTYSYNTSSVVGEDLIDDYGSVSENHLDSSDYGFIGPFAPGEDYGLITDSLLALKKPFGLFSINGAATQSVAPASHISSGSLFTFVSGTETTGVKPPVSGLFVFSGTAIEKNTENYVGSGTLFNFITKKERRTYSYNGSSIVLKTDSDYRFISETHQDSDDYGLITSVIITSVDDYGLISTRDLRPYGTLKFVGDNAQTTRFRLRYFGSGSLFTFVSGAETSGVKPPVSGLFKFSGAAAEATSPATEVGSGTLFNFITKEERRTYSYNATSQVITEVFDYGLISDSHQTSSDYGFIANESYVSEDYGYIISVIERRPYGRLRFSGTATNVQQVASFVGSGSLISFTGSAERVRFSPKTSIITRFRGSAAEAISPATEIGSGSLFTFVSKTESTGVKPPVAPGLFKFSGAVSDIKLSSAEFSSGTLFAFTGSAESVGVAPTVSGLLRFRSNTTEVYSKTNVVSGTLRSRSYAAIYDSEDKIRLVGAFESTSAVPAIVGGPIKVQGEVGRIFFQYGERGEGRFTITGEAIIKTNPIHFGGGFINVRGFSGEATVPAPHIGSGSLFAFIGSAESTTPAGEIGSTLFKFFGGISSIKETTSEVGSGLITVNVESSVTPIWDYPVSGKLSVVGDSGDVVSRNYNGSGRLTLSGIAIDYFTNRFFSFGDPIRIRRTDTPHSTTIPFIASGSLFGFVSATEATGANPPERILPIKLSGGATVRRTESHSGSGSIIGRHKSAIGGVVLDLTEATIAELADQIVGDYAEIPINAPKTIITGEESKQRLVAAYESVTASPESKDRAIQIIGSRDREIFVPTNTGSGKLFGFGSSAESTSFVPAKTTELFKVVGSVAERKSVSNLGTGSLFGFGSSTESFFAAVPQEPSFARITGSATQSFTPAPHIGSGTISTFTGASESSTFSPDLRVLFEFTGSSVNTSTRDYKGSGTIFSFIGTAHAVAYDYAITQKAFKIFGSTFESFGKSNYFGECQAQFVGASTDNKVNFESPKPIQIIMI